MTQVLSLLAGNELAGFILVLARVGPLFLLAPPFSSPMVPPRVRGIIAVGISIGLAPIALHGQHIPTDPFTLAALIVEGMLVGLASPSPSPCCSPPSNRPARSPTSAPASPTAT